MIKTVSDSHPLITSDSDATTMRIAPRDYANTDSSLTNIRVKDNMNRGESDQVSGGDSSVSMIIGADVGHEHDDGDVTDRYLIKESDVKDKSGSTVADST